MNRISFPAGGDYYKNLRERVDQYFLTHNMGKTGNWKMYLKTTIILLFFITSYVGLVFFSDTILIAVIFAFCLAQSFVLIGFNIMHDGNHDSYSEKKIVNRLMGFSMDLIGGSSTIWRQKHNILHHTFTNIDGKDVDLETNGLLRLSPNQEWRPWHRFQHWYALPVYSLLTLSWMLYNDFQKYFSGHVGTNKLRRFNFSESLVFFLTKAIYFSYMLLIPMLLHPVILVIIFYIAIHLVLGLTLSVVFQLAHTVEEANFPLPAKNDGIIEKEWAVHQLETTADFARGNRLAAWYLGGLNFQVEHHLFSRICHIHYPAISKIVQQTCEESSVNYMSYPSVWSAVRAHFRFLKAMSQPVAMAMV